MNLIFGANGHATEIEWLAHVCSTPLGADYRAHSFVVQDVSPQAKHVGLPVITESEALQIAGPLNGFIAVGQPQLRQQIWRKFDKPATSWPVLMHPSVIFDSRPGRLDVGQGCFVFPGCTLTSQIKIGQHVHVNVDCSISHDVCIGDFCTLSPGVRLAGKVHLADRVFVGMGAVVIDKIHICSDAIIGAGAVVVSNIEQPGIYVGVPAKMIK